MKTIANTLGVVCSNFIEHVRRPARCIARHDHAVRQPQGGHARHPFPDATASNAATPQAVLCDGGSANARTIRAPTTRMPVRT